MQLAPMLLQPLLENAIRHGLEPRIKGGRIDVSAIRENAGLVLTVHDTGLCLDAPASHGTGLGLENVRERLLALYGPGASLTLADNAPCGTVATLTIPLP